jgi:hypothetical protein
MRRLFHQGSIFPLAKSCFVFEDDASNTNLNLGDTYPGLVIIPSIMGNKKLYIGTLLADLCSQIIGEFGQLVRIIFDAPSSYLTKALKNRQIPLNLHLATNISMLRYSQPFHLYLKFHPLLTNLPMIL